MHVPSSIQMDGSLVSNVDTILVSKNRLTQHRGPHLKRKRPFKNSIDRFVKCNLVVKVMDNRRRDLDCTKLPTWIKLPSLFRLLVAQLMKQPTHPQCVWWSIWTRQETMHGTTYHLCRRRAKGETSTYLQGERKTHKSEGTIRV